MSDKNPYSPFKMAHHQDKLSEMKDGKQPIPLQVQLIISDLCNENCSFCLESETLVYTSGFGLIPIKDLQTSNSIKGPSGDYLPIKEISSRKVDKLYVLKTKSLEIKVTEEHRFLTAHNGWMEARNITEEDSLICSRTIANLIRSPVDLPIGVGIFSKVTGSYVNDNGFVIQLEDDTIGQRVRSISLETGEFEVFNITCEPDNAFYANGIVVHNCAYRMENYTSNQMFGEKDPMTGIINNNPNRMIPYPKALEILEDCKAMGVKAMQFTGGGEPTVHPKHKELFQKTLDLGMDLSLVSNAVIMREGVPEILAKAKWARFSIDAATEDSYASIREVPKSFFHKAIANIQKVVKAKKDNNGQVIIGVGFVVTKENYLEIYDFVKMFSQLGVDNVRISAVFTPDDFEYHRQIYPVARDLTVKAKAEFERPDFKVFNLFGDRVQDLIDHAPEYEYCGYMHLNTYIGGDLNVYTCCNNAYNEHGLMGSIKHQGFKDFWFSNEKIKKYLEFKANSCARCMFNNKNRFINYLLEKDPLHVNYI